MKTQADVCMLLEGTYPFVRGGVSSWVHQLITGLPELTFSLVFIGGRRTDYAERRYQLPDNVVHLETHYLEDALKDRKPNRRRAKPALFDDSHTFHEYLKQRGGCPHAAAASTEQDEQVDRMLGQLETPAGLSVDDFLFHPEAWELIRDAHLEGETQTSFVDYFWTLRLMHGPIFQLARIARGVPEARTFHTVSTGYAGFLGALLAQQRRRPLILSEHGIYTKERRIDLNQSDWFERASTQIELGANAAAAPRQLWIRCFESLGRLTYRAANPIVSLYAGNRERQHQDGAAPERTRVIVNGIDAERFRGSLLARGDQVPRSIGLIGRVVPIKDIKTFIRTLQLVNSRLPDVEGLIVGSEDEDPAYGQECKALARSLGIEHKLRFLGHQDVSEMLPKLGLLMLTSISEAQPLAVLEAFAAGVPCVTTDVGACREQIEGGTDADKALGLAGRVVPFADAEALASAAVELLSSPDTWHACQRAGLARVRHHYAVTDMLHAYRELYRVALET